MTKAQESLRIEIEKINDEATIEKLRIYIMGILTQQGLEELSRQPPEHRTA